MTAAQQDVAHPGIDPSDTREERFRPVPGYDGRYEVSDRGTVRSVDRICPTGRAGGMRPVPGTVLKQRVNRVGYFSVSLWKDNHGKNANVHRLVARAFLGEPPQGAPEVRHMDGNQRNNNLSNLQYGSASENRQDTIRHGTNYQLRKTICPLRHELTDANNLPGHARRGFRSCRACNGARMKIRQLGRSGRTADFRQVADLFYAQFTGEISRAERIERVKDLITLVQERAS